MRVLVTGSSGRLGPFVVRELVAAGHEVTLLSRRAPAAEFAHLPWTMGDINDSADCHRALRSGFDAIQHLAAQPWPADHPAMRSLAEERHIPPDATMRTNILGLYNLLQAAVAKGIGTFVMTGSNCALGHGFRISHRAFPFRHLPIDETHPGEVEDSYSFSKRAGEELLASFTRAYGMRTYAIRAAEIFTEKRRRKIAENTRPTAAWDDWLWAWVGSEDVAAAHRLIMERAAQLEPHGVYFCNADDTRALEPSLELLALYRPELLPLARDLAGHASFFSNQRLRQAVGWQHRTSWRIHLQDKSYPP